MGIIEETESRGGKTVGLSSSGGQSTSTLDFIREKEIGFDCVYFGVSSLAISLKVSAL